MKTNLPLSVACCVWIAGVNANCLTNNKLNGVSNFSSPKEMIVKNDGRLFFYTSPSESCKIKNLFVVNNDHLLSFYELSGFTYVNFLNRKNKIIDGWVHSNRLTGITNKSKEKIEPITLNDFQVTYKNEVPVAIGSSDKKFDKWASSIKLTMSDPTLSGIDENNWTVSFDGGYIELNEANDIIKRRLKYSNDSDIETYLAVFNISGKGFTTHRGISIGSTWTDLVDKYGKNNAVSDGGGCISYPYFNMKIAFCEKDNKVSIIEVSDVIKK